MKFLTTEREEDIMSTYISLFNWTDQGIRNIKDAPQRIDHFKKSVEATGGKVKGFYFTMGKYDGVVIVEYPDIIVDLLG